MTEIPTVTHEDQYKRDQKGGDVIDSASLGGGGGLAAPKTASYTFDSTSNVWTKVADDFNLGHDLKGNLLHLTEAGVYIISGTIITTDASAVTVGVNCLLTYLTSVSAVGYVDGQATGGVAQGVTAPQFSPPGSVTSGSLNWTESISLVAKDVTSPQQGWYGDISPPGVVLIGTQLTANDNPQGWALPSTSSIEVIKL